MAALRLACAVLAAGLFAPYASARLAARGGISHTDPVILVARVLRGSRSKRAPPTAELVERLVEPGAASLPALLSILETRWVPFSGAPDEKPQSLSAPQRELVLGALERLNANEVIAAVERRLRTAHDPPQIEAGIYALGAAGDSRQLARIVAMVP